jgi:hypothetical protein
MPDDEFLKRIETLLESRSSPPAWQAWVIPFATTLLAIGGFYALTQDRLARNEKDIESNKAQQVALHARVEQLDRAESLEIDRLQNRVSILEMKK